MDIVWHELGLLVTECLGWYSIMQAESLKWVCIAFQTCLQLSMSLTEVKTQFLPWSIMLINVEYSMEVAMKILSGLIEWIKRGRTFTNITAVRCCWEGEKQEVWIVIEENMDSGKDNVTKIIRTSMSRERLGFPCFSGLILNLFEIASNDLLEDNDKFLNF